jgi:hypothetical protein
MGIEAGPSGGRNRPPTLTPQSKDIHVFPDRIFWRHVKSAQVGALLDTRAPKPVNDSQSMML